jgi:tRNA (cmo5U34)-methyltransferase
MTGGCWSSARAAGWSSSISRLRPELGVRRCRSFGGDAAAGRGHEGAVAARIRLHEGYVDSAPAGPFDAAVCLLTLHFIPAAERLDTLRHLHRRLKQGAPLVVAHHSFSPQPPERDIWLARYAAYAVGSGYSADLMAKNVGAIGDRLPVLSPQDDEALMHEAGFRDVSLFYAALTFLGWVAYA